MQPLEISSRKRSRKPLLYLFLLLLLGGAGYALYRFGPGLYYQMTGDAILRIKNRSETFEKRYLSGEYPQKDLFSLIESTRKTMDIIEKDNPTLPEIHYYRSLFDYYEFLLRVPLTPATLIQMTGRGYLPTHTVNPELPPLSTPVLARRFAMGMRKVLALDPDFSHRAEARLIIATGDLFYTGRTDPNLLRLLDNNEEEKLSPFFQPPLIWLKMALYTVLGKKEQLSELVQKLRTSLTDPDKNDLKLDEIYLDMVLCHGYFYARDYLRALTIARRIKFNPAVPTRLQVEAARMEAEIFLVQRGPLAARYFFQEALRLSGGSDPFIESRLAEISR